MIGWIALGATVGNLIGVAVAGRVSRFHLIRAGYWQGRADLLNAADRGPEGLLEDLELSRHRCEIEDGYGFWRRVRIGGSL